MSECYDPTAPVTTEYGGPEYIDTDFDGNPDEVLSGDSVPFPGGSGDTIYEVPDVRS